MVIVNAEHLNETEQEIAALQKAYPYLSALEMERLDNYLPELELAVAAFKCGKSKQEHQ